MEERSLRIRITLFKDFAGNYFFKIPVTSKRTINVLKDFYGENGEAIEEIEKLDSNHIYHLMHKQTKINRAFSIHKDIYNNDPTKITSILIKQTVKHFESVLAEPVAQNGKAFIICKTGKTPRGSLFPKQSILRIRRIYDIDTDEEKYAIMCFEKFRVVESIGEYLPLVYYSNSVRYKTMLEKLATRLENVAKHNEKGLKKYAELVEEIDLFRASYGELTKDYRNLLEGNGKIHYSDCVNFNKRCVELQNTADELTYDIIFMCDDEENDTEINYDLQTSRNDCVFYRGLPDMKYNCLSKIYRSQIHFALEDTTYREYRMKFPEQFQNKTTIESITMMQHFGCPTRLLDVTTNPLVALFMSCYSGFSTTNDSDKVGEVIIFFPRFVDNDNEIKYYDSRRVALLSCLSRLDAKEKKDLKTICSNSRTKKMKIKEFLEYDASVAQDLKRPPSIMFFESIDSGKEAIKHLLSLANQEYNIDCSDIFCSDLMKSYYVKTPLNNERIRAQSGCFILSGLDRDYIDEHFSSSRNETNFYRIIIKDKQNLLSELQQLNIHQASMMPDMVNVADYLTKNKY